eukprot:856151_1
MSAGACDFEDVYRGSYFEFAIAIPLCIIYQLAILSNSIYYEIKKGKRSDSKMKLSLRISFLFLQFCGLYFSINDLLRFVIDPWTSIVHDNVLCDLTAYSPKFINVLYYTCYEAHILLRLRASFQGSFIQLRNSTVICLSLFLVAGVMCAPLILIFSPAPCHWEWLPMDLNHTLSLCAFRNFGIVNVIILGGIGTVVIANITYGAIFTIKLKKLLSRQSNAHITFQLKTVVIKNVLLTIIGCGSTLLNYVLWIVIGGRTGIGACFLYMDVCINVTVIALMFKYNEKYFKALCRGCVLHCLTKVDQSYDKTDVKEMSIVRKRIEHYFQRDMSSMFSHTGQSVQSATDKNGVELSGKSVVELSNDKPMASKDHLQTQMKSEQELAEPIEQRQIEHVEIQTCT